jgi:glycerol-3-phosphate cytidylyltransferase-like family protein
MMLVSGKFDPLHGGHVAFFQAVRGLTDEPLMVCVLPDGDPQWTRPSLLPAPDRATVVAALGGVQHVTIEEVPKAIRQHRPRLYAKGVEWAGKLPEDILVACRLTGTRIVYVDSGSPTHSADVLSVYLAKMKDERW